MSRAECGVPEAAPSMEQKVVRLVIGWIFWRQPFLYQDFSGGSKLVYLVVDPAGVFLYPVILIDMGWRTRTISDT